MTKKDFIKECRLYMSLIKYFDRILDKKFKLMLYPILKQLPIELPSSIQSQFSSSSRQDFSSSEFDLLLLDEIESGSNQQYLKLSLELVEPVDNVETPIRFQPGLVSVVKIKAILNNFSRFDNLFIQVMFRFFLLFWHKI